jgi:phosphoenolpyruvate carboxylase
MSMIVAWVVAVIASLLAALGFVKAKQSKTEAEEYRYTLDNITRKLRQAVIDKLDAMENEAQAETQATDIKAKQEVVNADNPIVNRWNKSGRRNTARSAKTPSRVNGSGDGRSEAGTSNPFVAGQPPKRSTSKKGPTSAD